jgi:hypothetical protein
MADNTSVAEIKVLSVDGELVKKICDPQTISDQELQIWNGFTEDCRVGPTAIYYIWIRYGELDKKTKTSLLPFYLYSAKNF